MVGLGAANWPRKRERQDDDSSGHTGLSDSLIWDSDDMPSLQHPLSRAPQRRVGEERANAKTDLHCTNQCQRCASPPKMLFEIYIYIHVFMFFTLFISLGSRQRQDLHESKTRRRPRVELHNVTLAWIRKTVTVSKATCHSGSWWGSISFFFLQEKKIFQSKILAVRYLKKLELPSWCFGPAEASSHAA